MNLIKLRKCSKGQKLGSLPFKRLLQHHQRRQSSIISLLTSHPKAPSAIPDELNRTFSGLHHQAPQQQANSRRFPPRSRRNPGCSIKVMENGKAAINFPPELLKWPPHRWNGVDIGRTNCNSPSLNPQWYSRVLGKFKIWSVIQGKRFSDRPLKNRGLMSIGSMVAKLVLHCDRA